MKRRHYNLSIAILVAILAPRMAHAQQSAPDYKTDPRELVIGDYYYGTITRQQATKELDGYLVHATDDWLVFGVILSEGRTEREIPWLGELPFLGAPFRGTHSLKTKNLFWVPRATVTLTGRESYPNQAGFEAFRGDAIKLEGDCRICLASGKQPAGIGSHLSGDLVGITDNTLNLTIEEYERRSKKSRWTGLPLVGGMFVSQETITHKVDIQVPLDDVIYIWQRSLYDIEKVKANQQKQAAN